MPDVAVIVCTRNRGSLLDETLDHILLSLDHAASDDDEPGLDTELIVVDNGSTDSTGRLIADRARLDHRIRPISEPEPGLGRARNTGVRAARSPALLFTDDDVIVPKDWVRRFSAPLRNGEADAVAGGVRMADHLWREWMSADLAAKYFAHLVEPAQPTPGLVGACMGATLEAATRIGFDEELGTTAYPGGEDSLFQVRLVASGARLTAVPGVVVEHRFSADRLDAAHIANRAVGQGRCDAYFYHHWLGARFSAPKARIALHTARLRRAKARARANPYDEEVLSRTRELSLHQHLLEMRGTPRKYGPRDGAPQGEVAPAEQDPDHVSAGEE